MHSSLATLEHKLRRRRANTRLLRRFMVRSSVASIVRDRDRELEVLLIKRAQRRGDRWSGHMAFPGGRVETGDHNVRATAMRETHEEIGLRLVQRDYIGRLSDVMTLAHGTRKPMVVSPYVFRQQGDPSLVLNHEVADTVWVPLPFFADHDNRDTMRWERRGVGVTLPCYWYGEYRIWGLTLRMIDELIELT
ncbi:nudix hydrolase [gamma proteobacterium HTCC5015]|nr:nudix hydrolase [gamma proteobacterium HTCC5015]